MQLVPSPLRTLIPTLLLALPATAHAQQADPAPAPAPVAIAAPPFQAGSIDDAALAAIAGREDVAQHATAEQVAGVSRNTVGDNVRTGDASIADNALQNLSGLSILNVNTGNNVAINAAMNVNIAINPRP